MKIVSRKQKAESRNSNPAYCLLPASTGSKLRLLPTASNTGFTLVETLVAITILSLAVTGSFFTANNALVAAATSRDRLTASYLAQEGIEQVRKLRDDAYLDAYRRGATDAWANFLASPGVGTISYPAPALGSNSFTRTIQVIAISATDEKIVSRVTWSYHGTNYAVTITDHLTPWQ